MNVLNWQDFSKYFKDEAAFEAFTKILTERLDKDEVLAMKAGDQTLAYLVSTGLIQRVVSEEVGRRIA